MEATRSILVTAVLLFSVGCQDRWLLTALDPDREGDAVGETSPAVPRPGGVVPEHCPPDCPPPAPQQIHRKPAPNPIPGENAKPGDASWRDGRNATSGEVEVYLSVESVEKGSAVGVKVSTGVASTVIAEVFRMGFYGGAGARKVWSGGPFATQKQPACPMQEKSGRVECAWADTFRFTVGDDWVSGLYLVKLRRPDGFKRFAPLVVRDRRSAELLFQPAFHTYQAYNTWGGESLYSDASGTMPSGKAYQVSYNRPYKDDEGAGQLLRWELPLARFLEQHGYDVTYGSNFDFDRYSDFLVGVAAFVHGGHDEYWSSEQREQVDRALQSGRTSLAHFGGNGAYWRTRSLSDVKGNPLRTLACYKGDPENDPLPGSTVRFRDEPNPHPENALFGAMYDGWQLVPFPMVVKNPAHWLFAGTGLSRGDLLLGLVGYEFDRIQDNGFSPQGQSLSMESPVVTAEGIPSVSHVVDRVLPFGNIVFSAGTIYWPLALFSSEDRRDSRLERMTLNVLERALAHRRSMRALPNADGTAPVEPAPDARWAQSVGPFAGIAGVPGARDGAASGATFNGPTGLAASLEGALFVADTNNNLVRKVHPDGRVETLAGNGASGARDGPGTHAMFRKPTGLAVSASGVVYVADSDNHVIRAIAADVQHTVTTVAGVFRAAGFADGVAENARFRRPTAVAIDPSGDLVVADQAGHRIRKIQLSTRRVSTIAGSGTSGDLDASDGRAARFNNPSALAVSADGEIYVFDGGNQKVKRIASGGTRAVVTLAGRAGDALGFSDGPGTQARFRGQMGMAISPFGELMVADTANYRIRKVVLGATAATTHVYTHAGSGRVGTALGAADQADLVAPAGLAFGPSGHLFVSDSFQHVIRVVTR